MTEERPRDRSALPVLEDSPPAVCRKLRTKMAFGSLEGVRDWRHGESSTAVYWCLLTMETAGPDDSFAHPHNCQSGRRCFVAPAAAGLVAWNDGDGGRDPGQTPG